MIKSNKLSKLFTLAILSCLLPFGAFAERITKDKVTVDYEVLADGTYRVIDVYNNSSNRIILYVDNNEVTINAGSSAKVNKISRRRVYFDSKAGGQTLLRYTAPSTPKPAEEAHHETVQEVVESPTTNIVEQRKTNTISTVQKNSGGSSLVAVDRINQDDFFGTDAVAYYVQKADSFTKALSQSENKAQFILDNDIKKFLSDSELELQAKKNEITSIAQEAVTASNISDAGSQTRTLNLLIETLNGRYNQRQTAYEKLQSVVDTIPERSEAEHSLKETIINYSIIGVIVLVLAIWMIIAIRRKKKKTLRFSKQSKHKPIKIPTPIIRLS